VFVVCGSGLFVFIVFGCWVLGLCAGVCAGVFVIVLCLLGGFWVLGLCVGELFVCVEWWVLLVGCYVGFVWLVLGLFVWGGVVWGLVELCGLGVGCGVVWRGLMIVVVGLLLWLWLGVVWWVGGGVCVVWLVGCVGWDVV